MWFADLAPSDAHAIFGPKADLIVAQTRRVLAGQPPEFRNLPPLRFYERPLFFTWRPMEPADAITRFGPNGIAVALWIETWELVPWRQAERDDRPLPEGVVYDEELYAQTPAAITTTRPWDADAPLPPDWRPRDVFEREWAAARAVGAHRPADDPLLCEIWYSSRMVTEPKGYAAAFFAIATLAELARPERDQHYFLSLMPWVWQGYHPIGWTDDHRRVVVHAYGRWFPTHRILAAPGR